LDGVLTPTAIVHKAAWEETFNQFLRQHANESGEPYVPFDPDKDYNVYVDGKPRQDGVRSFLASRGISLPEGDHDDAPDAQTVHGVGNRKNVVLLERLREHGVEPYEGSMRYLRAAVDAGLRRAVVSSSANCQEVVEAAGMENLLEVRVDGVTAREKHLRGKPHPDTFLLAAERLGVMPGEAAVFEDAISGVEAGRAGEFGFVVGVDRVGQAEALSANGADVVVDDLEKLLDGAQSA
jgi:beta-phosphoglucomutase family hydrolase